MNDSMEQTKIDTALNLIMGMPSKFRGGVMAMAQTLSEMTVEERAELERTVERVERFASKRIRQQAGAEKPTKRRGRPPKTTSNLAVAS